MLLFCFADLHSQILAVKSDLLTGILSSPNFGVEVKLSNRLTLEAGFHYNPFAGRRRQALETLVCAA